MNRFLNEIKNRVLIFDGSKGYMLQKLGLKGGECPELWNVTHRDEVKKVYSLYKEAGSDVIQTNTFQGNRIQLEKYSLGERTYELNFEGARLAREVMGNDGFVAASIGPVGKLFEPSGDLTFDMAYEIFKEQVKAVADGGVDIINFETFTDLAELRAALLAAKETTDLPVISSIAFESNGRTLMGTDPYTAVVVLKSLGADMIGTNCSFGPEHMLEIVPKMSEVGGIYLSVKPNAGLPEIVDDKVIYKESPQKFAETAGKFVKYGARLVGGCCGTTPEFIREVSEKISKFEITEVPVSKDVQLITSSIKFVSAEDLTKGNIGHLITGTDEELLSALAGGNLEIISDRALDMSTEGYDAIYINIDKAGNVKTLLANVVNIAQGYIREPLIIETNDPEAMAGALRLYKGRAGVVISGQDGKKIEELGEIAKKYGSAVITDKFPVKN